MLQWNSDLMSVQIALSRLYGVWFDWPGFRHAAEGPKDVDAHP